MAMGPLPAGVLYFAVTYSAGFLFGTLRELLLVPNFGSTVSILIETPAMLAVTYFAASWIIRRLAPPLTPLRLLGTGLIGFGCLMLAELAFAMPLRGLDAQQWLAHFSTMDGAISLAMFVLFAVMPWLIGRRQQPTS